MATLSRWVYQLALFGLLFISSCLCLVLKKVHTIVNGVDSYSFLNFNLVLAWIPLVAAGLAYAARRKRAFFYLVLPICTLVWLIFFPNAPYLLTDFQHLANSKGDAPLWFNVIVLVWFAWTGLLLGIASLYLMQEMISDRFNGWTGWVFAIGATIASSIGIFLGRFLRWNSWDLLRDPIPIARDMASIVRHPITNLPTYVFTVLFTLLFLFIYVAFHLFGRIMRERTRD